MSNALLRYWNLHRVSLLIALLCGLLYYAFGYHLLRSEFTKLCVLYAALFFLCYKLIQFEKWNFRLLLVLGLLFRIVLLFSIPNLSQDFYRFLWDGHLVLIGENPYLYTPDGLMESSGALIPMGDSLLRGMGPLSAANFSNYPPLSQLLYAVSVWLGGGKVLGSLIAMRSILLLADVGIFYFGRKLLKLFNRSPHLIFWYFLNPLVIIELGGNVHFEGVMLCFLLCALYLIHSGKWVPAALVLSLSISVKLIPLMFLPLFFKTFGLKKGLMFNILVILGVALTALPFYHPQFSGNYLATLSLWFSNFEFNASIYNVVKHLGSTMDLKPWELIKTYGKIFPFLVIAWVGLLSFLRGNRSPQDLALSMLLILTLYFFMSPTVHPWYIISLVVLCLFTDFRFPLIWSATLILSYSAYRTDPEVVESMGFLVVEYLSVYAFLVYELFKHRSFIWLIPKN
ncbi:hypothetical protein SAMN06265375_10190 [Muriicola jejuensis]|uniref:Mannosyltransferase n=1 Tax=Muriicola jejuensis TaxID=504488 RepID=A0A6P0UBG1_9FLAO|nr:mannosyltransferase [Muriicola jejuensis]NER10367.1 mannosyltransferase [Muriicola jejuensis]SMP01062.1 hypothetical protein SAMN06265375_10190 [Muriicola jejuensis]